MVCIVETFSYLVPFIDQNSASRYSLDLTIILPSMYKLHVFAKILHQLLGIQVT
jgi:hypothetical protein